MPSSLYVIPFRIRVSPSVTDTSTARLGVAADNQKSGDQGVHDHVSLLSKSANWAVSVPNTVRNLWGKLLRAPSRSGA